MTPSKTYATILLLLLTLVPIGCDRADRAPLAPLHFTDVTTESGIDMTITSGQTPSTQLLEVKGGGLALIDFDNDDDLDVFVPNGATLDQPEQGPGCRLYENLGDLRFSDVTAKAGLEFRRWGFGTAVGDYDGDGFDDIFVACFGRNALLRNKGGGRFEEVTESSGVEGDVWSTAAAFGDVDRDGDLDLYVTNFVQFDPASPPGKMLFFGIEVFGGPMGVPPVHDVLYENLGDGTFRDISITSGCRSVSKAYGLGVLFLDFDGDGRPEIFVGNDSGANFLFWRNDDGPFQDIAATAGIATNEDGGEQATMGIAIADVNDDGLPDLFTSNFMNDTNTLHVSLESLLYEDRTRIFGLRMASRPYLGWSSMFNDFDLDGDEDLLIFNGHTYPETITAGPGWNHNQEPLLYERVANRFSRVTPDTAGPWLAEKHCDRSAVFGDLDSDGDIDIIVGELNGPVRVLENDGAKGDYLIVSLDDERPGSKNHRALGSRVVLHAGDRRWTRWLHAGGSYQASNAPSVHFGLPRQATAPFRLEITWPDGHQQLEEDVSINQSLKIVRHP